MPIRDMYSNHKFIQAYTPQDLAAGAKTTGISIDRRGYETVTFVINIGTSTDSAAANSAGAFWQLMLEHYNSAQGAWSEVYPSQMLHSVVGEAGAYSTLNSGIFQSITTYTELSTAYAVGYRGPHRSVRIAFSEEGTPSLISVGAICILGLPSDWPVQAALS